MIILLDVGNSRVKLGWQHPSLGREPAVHVVTISPLAQLGEQLDAWIASLPVGPVAARGVNVAGRVVAELVEASMAQAGCAMQWLQPTASLFGVLNRYENPQQLGADRWAALIGLAGQFGDTHPPLVLATFGTATTIDTLGPDQTFEGGLILPGPALMRQSLAQGTANLPLATGESNDYPRHTLQAISTGVVAAQAGAVWRQCSVATRRYGTPPTLCVSGGGWPEVEAEVRQLMGSLDIRFLPNPVLDGLARAG